MTQSPTTHPAQEGTDTLFQDLVEAFRRERASAGSGLVDWQYIRHKAKTEDQRQLAEWHGKESLLHWIRIMGATRPMECGYRLLISLLEESNAFHERLFENLGQRFDTGSMDLSNAVDFHVCSLLPHVQSVLDYGAGHGRQAFLFSRIPGINIFANDAVETSYFSQYYVFRTLGFPLWEYFDHQVSLPEFLATKESKVIHLPTWRNDLIPDASLDLVLFVWCFSEMSSDAALHAIDTCTKKLKEGGYVYLRDEPHSHGLSMEKEFVLRGFLPVFQPWTLPGDLKMNGIPRLYRYLPNYLSKRNTAFCGLLFTAWRKRTFSLKQMLVRLRRMIPF